uniref:Uncharacterized protein n=1 Tax=Alexandrium catenella TaxID=2925 RepID=A0A7S1WX31_ALECA|mmetsp:Transcript_97164/g.258206  ORF Transcript_97164/g.258206 Transcript_97164/m.258206 type:complete len:311 (+) Transcript_97164:82-1014(+)
MNFTPQQLTGGPRYNARTRVGNWSEDLELEEIKLKDYLKKKESGSLIVTAKQQQLEASLAPAELSASPDGMLHFGHRVMIANHQSKAFLNANAFDPVPKSHDAWILTTGPNGAPSVRNVFELERADPHDGFDDDVIHYGQNLRCKLHPFSKIDRPAYMHSELVTALAAAKFSRHQEVTVLAAPTGETLWQILFPDTANRFEMEGEPVPAGSPVVLRHVQTGSFLASDEIPYNNLFGQEFEVHCFAYYSLSKTQNLTSEKKGQITGDYALRKHGLPNIWSVVTETHGVGGDEGTSSAGGSLGGTQLPEGGR